MSPGEKHAKWLQVRRQASSGFVGLSNRLVDSLAFQKLGYAPALKVLVWFWQMTEYAKEKRKPGQDSPVGRIDKILNNRKISFTYQEAQWRGLSSQQFSHALKELFRLGFIDVPHLGRGLQGDYTKFALSDRWKKYGTPEWKENLFPENFFEGFRKRSKGKVTGEKSSLPMVDTQCYDAADFPHNGGNSSLQTAVSPDSQRRVLTVSVDLARGTTPLGGFKKKELGGQGSDRAGVRYDDASTSITANGEFDYGPWAECEPLTADYGWGEEATL